MAKIVSEGAIAAANPPAQLLLPLAAGAFVLRTIVLVLEILVETEAHAFQNITSECHAALICLVARGCHLF